MNKGGYPARIGEKLHKESIRINEERIKKHGLKGKISTETITNLIVTHLIHWAPIAEDIIKIPPKEIEEKKNGAK